MPINQKIKQEIVNLLKKQKIDIAIDDFNIPPSPGMGDLALPCFKIAKKMKKTPSQAAEDLAQKIKPKGLIINLKNLGPYLNFFFNYDRLAELILKEVNKSKNKYGQNKNGKGQKVMIEYSQPNTHKEFHVGHLRNVCIGFSLVNIYKICGYKVIAANYIGDTGSHVAKTLWYYLNFLNQTDFPSEPKERGEFLGQLYTWAVKKMIEKEDYKFQVADILKKLETGDKKLTALWKQTRKWSLDQFENIYKELGAKFDIYYFESIEEKEGKKMMPQLLNYEFIKKSEGAVIADLEKYNLGTLVLLRNDGTVLYGLKDIPLAIKKFKKYKLDKSLYMVDTRQSQYFKQIFKILELMDFKSEMVHVPYEFVQLKSGVISSRTGNIVTYQEVKEAALYKVINETKERHPDWNQKKIEKTAMDIILAALKFGMLKTNNNKVITFDLNEALDVNGFSGPYLQYTMARLNSILKKAGKLNLAKVDYRFFEATIEKDLIKDLLNYPEKIIEVIKTNDPSVITQYLFYLAQNFNTFYHQLPVLQAEPKIRNARLALIKAVKQVLKNGMNLIGLPILKEM